MAAVSGKNGTVVLNSETLEIKNFSIDIDGGVNTYATSATSGWMAALAGTKAWTASVECVAPDGDRLASVVGTAVACVFTLSTGNTLTGNAIVGSESYSVDVEGGEAVTMTIEITGNGALS